MIAASGEARRLLPVKPRTMVEQAAEAIVSAAARGIFLPGDRLVEAEIARDLGISRVPVREALRLLESQGIVVSTPYKGMRLMQATNKGLAALMRVRLALESLAVREALGRPEGAASFAPLAVAAEAYAAAVRQGDPALIGVAEQAFHAGLCEASGNAPLLALWQSLSRQLAVVWGLTHAQEPSPDAGTTHEALLAALMTGDPAVALAALEAHVGWYDRFDIEAAIAARRRAAAVS